MNNRCMNNHGPWKILSQRQIYQDPWMNVRKDDVLRPDGHPGTYSIVELKPGVTVLALDENGDVYLTEEFHYGVGRVTIEAVSGGIEPGEQPAITAERELQEELGIKAGQWTDLGTHDPFTANVVSPTRLYLARQLTFGVPSLEGTEQIECVKMPLTEAVRQVIDGRISHMPSCLAILKAKMSWELH